ncbi:hypothetical protein M1P97_19805 [Parabacteroides sp. GYB001]|uniref:hypothetical protein n=1 Tax=Parabacteroides leei TaxID=2939491 RepID=UPI0020174686|nr:hypothetical protein [Parabacteroides leei]MCL3853531.1 hypothetical protein [Parabacteroides leei]
MKRIEQITNKLEQLEKSREKAVNVVARYDLKIMEQKEKIAAHYRKLGINI